MTKQLSIALGFVFAVACKTDAPSPGSAAPAGGETAAKPRSAKIAVKPVQPALPPAPEDKLSADDKPSAGDKPSDATAERDEWRQRRKARLDTNGDGVVSEEERAAAMQERVTTMHARLDADGDGKLTPAELGRAGGRMHFDNPAALDTNHDDDISADELAVALKARLEQWRSSRGSADQDTP